MTLYAKSSIMGVEVSGAGHAHRRPFVQGLKTVDPVYEKMFAVTCPFCEAELRNDPDWSSDPAKVPLTKDEQDALAAEEKTGNSLVAQMAKEMARAGQEAVRGMQRSG